MKSSKVLHKAEETYKKAMTSREKAERKLVVRCILYHSNMPDSFRYRRRPKLETSMVKTSKKDTDNWMKRTPPLTRERYVVYK